GEALGELIAVEAPVAVGELDLAARDRTCHRQHGGARREAGLVETAADRGLRAGHRLVVDDRHPRWPATRRAHREASGAATDVCEEDASHANTHSHTTHKCERRELFRAARVMVGHSRSKNGVASLAYARPSTTNLCTKAWMPAFAGMTSSLFLR